MRRIIAGVLLATLAFVVLIIGVILVNPYLIMTGFCLNGASLRWGLIVIKSIAVHH